MQQDNTLAPSRGRKWELFHSLWIGWTFTLGFLSWLAFVYIGVRTRHSRWVLWGLFYATPLILFLFFEQGPNSWQTNLTLTTILALGVVSIVHAFLVRKEYMLRLELLHRETSNVSVTSRGRRWELLHSLWIGWTFTLGWLSWLAFLYIGLRAKRVRWILWGLLYFVPLMSYLTAHSITGPNSGPTRTTIPLMVIAGIFSVVHAFLVRNEYLVRLEERMQERVETDTRRRRIEAEYGLGAGESPLSDSPEGLEPAASATTGGAA